MISVTCTSRTEARMVSVRSVTMVSLMPDGMALCSRGSAAFTSCTVCTMLAPGWRWMSSTAAGWSLYHARDAVVLHAVDHAADVGQANRRAVAPGDHQVLVGGGIDQLVVGAEGEGKARAVEAALGAVHIGVGDGGAHVLHRQSVGGEAGGIDAHPHRGAQAALHGDAADAVDFGQFRLQQRVGGVADLVDRQGVGGQRQRQDRRVGRVHLGVDRRVGKVGRQRTRGGVDRGLHVLRGGIHAAVEVELQRDLAGALGALRGHRDQTRDLAELALQRGGDQGLHGFRAGAGKLGGHLDGGEVDLRQRGDRQRAVAQGAGQQDRDRQQPGGDGAGDEGGGDVHGVRGPRFTPVPRLWRRRVPGAAGRSAARRASRRRGLDDRHLAAVVQPRRAVHHHLVAGLHPFGDDRLLRVLMPDRHVAPRGRAVGVRPRRRTRRAARAAPRPAAPPRRSFAVSTCTCTPTNAPGHSR